MSTSLARRTRRIGLLPQLSLEEVLDTNMLTKLKNARDRAASGKADDVAYLAELEADLTRQVSGRRVQKLDLTPEEIAKQAAELKELAKAKRVDARRVAAGKSAVRVARIKKAFAPKAA